MTTTALEAIRCPTHGAEMHQRPQSQQTPEQKWCGVWWDCQCCGYSILFQSPALREQERKYHLTATYDAMPMQERTLVKWLAQNPMRFGGHIAVRNDDGEPCDWIVYLNDVAIGMVIYRGGRKLCVHGIVNA